jgi:ubiquinone/menaquinone biosynthesis C-methylase UbiE
MTPARSAQEQFDRQATQYNAEWNAWNGDSLAWLLARARCQPAHTVLDVATGAGFTAVAFAPLAAAVIGLDVSTGMLAEARERARAAGLVNLTFETGAAESLPFPPARFDIVVCRLAAHHFLSVPRFAAEAYRVLRPGGRLLVSDTAEPDGAPEVDAWHNRLEVLRDPSHVRNYTPAEWRAFAAAAGFIVEEVEQVCESGLIGMNSWIAKGGCDEATAAEVRRQILEAPPEAVRAFSIARSPDGDATFQWVRVALSAVKPSRGAGFPAC